MKTTWIVFDLIGVLAEPSWRDILPERKGTTAWKKVRVGADESTLWDASSAETYRKLLSFREDRLELVKALREQGFKICIASNFPRTWLDSLFESSEGTEVLFDATVLSSEVHVAKPETGFWKALKRTVPGGAVFVDDNRTNCTAAEKAGFLSVWAYPGAELKEEIAARLAA